MSLPLPPFFDPAAAGRVYRVPYQERAAQAREWAARHGVRPAAEDARRTALLLVDVQNTFCLPEFELFVGGRWAAGRSRTASGSRPFSTATSIASRRSSPRSTPTPPRRSSTRSSGWVVTARIPRPTP